MKKIAVYIILVLAVYSCGSNNRGEVVGDKSGKKWYTEKPFGMVLVPGGAFTMGKSDEDPFGGISTPTRSVTVKHFYMDESEITNSEYNKFVEWVRDSIVRTELALTAEERSYLLSDGEGSDEGIFRYSFKESDTTNATEYERYMFENYGGTGDVNSLTEGKSLNWRIPIVWDRLEYPDAAYTEVMDSMYLPLEDTFEGQRILNVNKLKYTYSWFDKEAAAMSKTGTRKDFIIHEDVRVYPDTTVWVKDFTYSYNDPIHEEYFWHTAYADYPVVGVNWYQARAFCNWRTKMKNDYLRSRKNPVRVPMFRLPTEAEWEFAARGGIENGTYPWGGPYTTDDRGIFLANFKPVRGNYAIDGALYTVEAYSYAPNGYGLYNMAGNVSEWTSTAYNQGSYSHGSSINANIEDVENKRKVVRGGSWKDIAYFLQVSTRDYEYADSLKSYIGFRTVQDFLGTVKNKK
ncbi:T9SS ring complex lipoprotein PorK/GldK [Flavicella marina]|uniref:type IX secretion system lipoprotein PorK/GldK n=1 Tax=Flavicella marina TaxID=1475951 RepID=UPI001263F531|nr:gliding motility lipoprotein GldK [Flavicella marina]